MIPGSLLATARRRRCVPLSRQPIVVTIDLLPPLVRNSIIPPFVPPDEFSFTTNAIGITGITVEDTATFFALATADPIPNVPEPGVYTFQAQISGTIDGLAVPPPPEEPAEAIIQVGVRIDGELALVIEPSISIPITDISTPFALPVSSTGLGIFLDSFDEVTFDLQVTLVPSTVPPPAFTVTIDPTSTVGVTGTQFPDETMTTRSTRRPAQPMRLSWARQMQRERQIQQAQQMQLTQILG